MNSTVIVLLESLSLKLREKCPYSEFFWPVFSRIRTEYGSEKLRTRTLSTQCKLIFYLTLMPLLRKLVVQIEIAGLQKSILNEIMKPKDFAKKNEFHDKYKA